MLKLLIVDDEDIVRRGIKTIIDWKKLGFEICGEAAAGEEAIEKITRLKPHLVLLDIKMPGLSGIDCLKHFSALEDKPEFLILSGYSDFAYAQSAVNYGAKGYLVKPIDEDLLEEKVKEIAEYIISESYMYDETKLIERKKKLTKMFIAGRVLEGNDPKDNADFQVVLFHPDLCGHEKRISELELKAGEALSLVKHMTFQHDGSLVLIAENENTETLLRHVTRFCQKLSASDPENLSGPMAAAGGKMSGAQGLLDSYLEAKGLLPSIFFFNGKYFITKDDVKIKDPAGNILHRTAELLACIEIYDLNKIEAILNDEERRIQSDYTDADEVKKICIAFIVELQNSVHSKYPEKELTTVPALELVNIVMTKNYFFEVFDIVRNFVTSLAEAFSSNTANSTILKVIQYVKNNFKEDLKLELLGELFNCNSAYLGKKFKEHTGVPFNTYLDVIRIEAAKEMLKNTDLKIYQISKLVGYSNTDYFFLKFKKHTNVTPKKFKTGNDD
ncbi:MAG TPA: response regulator [Treponemataceae bacterium]|nr:response regulator [Treponemataceae bacterium]HQL04822.1 response regulator [Treponemataceae bacterium]